MRTLKDLKVRNGIDGWKHYYIQSLNKQELDSVLKELQSMYLQVSPWVGRFVGTATFEGSIHCKDLKIGDNK